MGDTATVADVCSQLRSKFDSFLTLLSNVWIPTIPLIFPPQAVAEMEAMSDADTLSDVCGQLWLIFVFHTSLSPM